MCFNQKGAISSLNGDSLRFVNLGSSISSTKSIVDMRIEKAWAAIGKLLIVWKSDLSDKI